MNCPENVGIKTRQIRFVPCYVLYRVRIFPFVVLYIRRLSKRENLLPTREIFRMIQTVRCNSVISAYVPIPRCFTPPVAPIKAQTNRREYLRLLVVALLQFPFHAPNEKFGIRDRSCANEFLHLTVHLRRNNPNNIA